jgi:hypothetical protein
MTATDSRCGDCGTGLGELNADRTGDLLCRVCYGKRYPDEAVDEPTVEALAREVTAEAAKLAKANDKGGPVAHTPGPGPGGHPNGRYDGRILDVAAMLAAPREPIPWRCEGFAADGYLTTLAGKGKSGKTWLSWALACGVVLGRNAAGIECKRGTAVLFDAENGRGVIKERFHALGVEATKAPQPVDCGGLRVTTDLPWFRTVIQDRGANLAVFDSLRVLSSGAKESDGDEMEPIITALKQLARETGAAIILVHHRGKSDTNEYRGSSVILDQTDMLFTLGKVTGDPEKYRRKIETVGCRIAEEPDPRWVNIEPDEPRGLVYINAAEPFGGEKPRDSLRGDILKVLAPGGLSGAAVAKALGRDKTDGTVRRILSDLEAEGFAARDDDNRWGLPTATSRGLATWQPPSQNGAVEPNEGLPLVLATDGGLATPPGCSCVSPADVTEDGRCSRCWGWPR